jgi:hypothetical protein
MPDTDQEVFEHFGSGYGDTEEVALMAYARYAKAKYDWVNHELGRLQRLPTEVEVSQWVAALPNSRLDEIRDSAVSQFQVAAEEFVRPRIEEARVRALESVVFSRVDAAAQRVERATSFWRNVLPNILVTTISSFVLAVFLIVAAVVYQRDPTVLGMFRGAPAQTQPGTAPTAR